MLATKILLVVVEAIILMFLFPLIVGILNLWISVATSTGLVNPPVTVAIVIRPLYNPILADHAELALVQQKDIIQKFSDCSVKCSDNTYLTNFQNEVDRSMNNLLPTGKDYRLEISYPQQVKFGNKGIKTNDTSEFTVVTPNFKYKNLMVWVG